MSLFTSSIQVEINASQPLMLTLETSLSWQRFVLQKSDIKCPNPLFSKIYSKNIPIEDKANGSLLFQNSKINLRIFCFKNSAAIYMVASNRFFSVFFSWNRERKRERNGTTAIIVNRGKLHRKIAIFRAGIYASRTPGWSKLKNFEMRSSMIRSRCNWTKFLFEGLMI